MEKRDELLQKLFHNQCSKAELELLFELIKADNSDVGPEIMEKISNQLGDIPDYKVDVFSRIKSNLDTSIEETPKQGISQENIITKSFSPHFLVSRIAASVLILIGLSWTIMQFLPDANLVEQTAFGEIKEFVLPDGSTVTLNGNSSLAYASNWDKGEVRKVFLEGEAFFEVEKKPKTQAKFQVITRGLTIEVLGTSFNVNYRGESTEVFLEEGKVRLKSEFELGKGEKELLLNPGEIIKYSAKKKMLSAPSQTSGKLQTSWKTGVLNFEKATIAEVLNRLAESNEFQYEFTDEKIKEERITTSIPIQDIEESLSIITKTTGLSYSKIDGIVIFSVKGD